jgi:hypothetical protein
MHGLETVKARPDHDIGSLRRGVYGGLDRFARDDAFDVDRSGNAGSDPLGGGGDVVER